MTIQEENEQLRDKIAQYEEFLEKMVEGPFSSGTVIYFNIQVAERMVVQVSP